jgi:hypothetical protein
MQNTTSSQGIKARLKPILFASDGWKVAGSPKRQPCAGWSAMRPGACFTLDLPHVTNVLQQAKFMAGMAMQSYSNPWANSTAQVKITLDHHHCIGEEANNTAESLSRHDTAHSFSGYHSQKTSSVIIPEKSLRFSLPVLVITFEPICCW